MHVCYLCFSDKTHFIGNNLDFETNIYICIDCGLIQNDFVSSAYLDQYYHIKYRQIRKESITENYLNFMSLRAESQYKFISNNLRADKCINNVIDIGASAGKLLEKFEVSGNIFAVESDQAMIEYMAKNSKIKIIDNKLLFDNENLKNFDMITMSHVFEHINNPIMYLYNLHKILSDNGYVFIEVPNEPAHLVAHNVKVKKKGIGHLFDYTIATLSAMICHTKLFEIIKISTYSVSVIDYINGASLRNFEENKQGDGIHIRCLLRKLDHSADISAYKYIDSVLQSRYANHYILESKIASLEADLKLKNDLTTE
jgi:2-polyprenyl-3-methyl-5-hydroxy-6-metoxy-1,4-benzoquinol methylase